MAMTMTPLRSEGLLFKYTHHNSNRDKEWLCLWASGHVSFFRQARRLGFCLRLSTFFDQLIFNNSNYFQINCRQCFGTGGPSQTANTFWMVELLAQGQDDFIWKAKEAGLPQVPAIMARAFA